jgi:hypothetical protein
MRHAGVELHIEELVLHGFAPGDRHRIGDAVERELARLVAEQGTPQLFGDSVELTRVNAGEFNILQGASPESVGAQIARAVYGGMSG